MKGFYLFFILLTIALLIWGVRAAGNEDASTGETVTFFVLAAVAAGGSLLTYRYEKRKNLNQ
jgi:hypothetical membrane protein